MGDNIPFGKAADRSTKKSHCYSRFHLVKILAAAFGLSALALTFECNLLSLKSTLSYNVSVKTDDPQHQQQSSQHRRLFEENGGGHDNYYNYNDNDNEEKPPLRVLHIVTALRDINNGARGTTKGEDRLTEVLIPILKNNVQSMISPPHNYQVDVYLVLGWKLVPSRRKLISDALPEGVGLQVWDDAIPLGYDMPKKDSTMKGVTRGLARQHRFVIRDKLDYYDLFSVFEDDMGVKGEHINHFLEMTEEIKKLKESAPDKVTSKQSHYGPLTKKQIDAMIPGFIRVEVLMDQEKWPSQRELAPIPVDLDFDMENGNGGGTQKRTFDPVPCCHVPDDLGKMPSSPSFDDIMIWETAIQGTVIQQMPRQGGTGFLDWVMLQPGKKEGWDADYVKGYWAGQDGAFGNMSKPRADDARFVAQAGGFMLTREQLIDMHNNHCKRGFFPPFEDTTHGGSYNQDGLTMKNVEFWSGGHSIFGGLGAACRMQRIINLHPDHFSKHFLYHTANNKQKTLQNYRFVKANNYFGQINSVVKAAKRKMKMEI